VASATASVSPVASESFRSSSVVLRRKASRLRHDRARLCPQRSFLLHMLIFDKNALRRRSEDSDPDTLSLAAHETSRGLSFVCCPNLRTETRQARGRAKTSAGMSASRERRNGSFHHECAGIGRGSRSPILRKQRDLRDAKKRLRVCRERRARLSAKREPRLHKRNGPDQNEISLTVRE